VLRNGRLVSRPRRQAGKPAQPGATSSHSQRRRENPATGHPHGQRPGRPDGSGVNADADLGSRQSSPELSLSSQGQRATSDGRILALIKAWLRAPIVERDPDTGRSTITGNRRGTPQGGVISPLLANLYLNRLDKQVNDVCEKRPVLVRYADDFVILTRPGQGAELRVRLKRWLEAHGLTLNETKTRLVDLREGGFKFLGYGVSWRRGKSGRNYPHIEPHSKSQSKLRDALRKKLNHWTLWRSAEEVIPEVNRLLKGWGGYFHYANSTRVFDRLNQYAANRLQRWLWRKQGCQQALWATNPREVLPGTLRSVSAAHAGGVDTGCGVEAMQVNDLRKAGCGKTARPV
jgi:hypothetical protein